MLRLVRLAPATIWRAFFCVAALAAAGRAAVPRESPPELAQVGKPEAEEAARILAQFRRAGVAGDFFFEFELRALPRTGEERAYPGRLWGGRRAGATVFRLELRDDAGRDHRWLIQNGEQASVWRLVDGKPVELDPAALVAPLLPGLEISAFDLQMPYLYWPEATLERIARVFGRPAYAYLFKAPPVPAIRPTTVAAARAYLDTQFNALMQTELLDASGRVVKTFALISLKRIAEQHIPKQADYRNELSRDKTRFQVTGAALNQQLLRGVFEPDGLARPVAPPAEGSIVRVDP